MSKGTGVSTVPDLQDLNCTSINITFPKPASLPVNHSCVYTGTANGSSASPFTFTVCVPMTDTDDALSFLGSGNAEYGFASVTLVSLTTIGSSGSPSSRTGTYAAANLPGDSRYSPSSPMASISVTAWYRSRYSVWFTPLSVSSVIAGRIRCAAASCSSPIFGSFTRKRPLFALTGRYSSPSSDGLV